MEVMARLLPQLIEQYEVVQKWTDEAQENPALRKKNHLRIFTWFMKRWAADQIELEHPADLEPWSVFRKRVSLGMEKIISDQGKGLNIAVFTSGGTVAASLGHALEMEKEERIVELNGIVKNTSMTTFLFSSGRVSLQSFNEVPHLSEKELITYV
jgi:broad specificity phosphatase PhoE